MSAISFLLRKPYVLGFTNTKHNALRGIRRFVGCHSDPYTETFHRPSYSRSALLTIILSLSILSASPIAIAQTLPRDANELATASLPTEYSNGWWSPERGESQTHPRLLVTASANIWTREPFGATNLPKANTACNPRVAGISKQPDENCGVRPAHLHNTCTPKASIAGVRDLSSGTGTVTGSPKSLNYSLIAERYRLPTDGLFSLGSLFDSIHTNHISWEQALSGSTTVTDESGVHFSPLLEVDVDRARFPILLYEPPISDMTQDAR
jgi:hypothetical protein